MKPVLKCGSGCGDWSLFFCTPDRDEDVIPCNNNRHTSAGRSKQIDNNSMSDEQIIERLDLNDDHEEEGEEVEEEATGDPAVKGKRKRRRKKKTAAGATSAESNETPAANGVANGVNNNKPAVAPAGQKKKGGGKGKKQTDPPSIPIKDLFPDGNYPEGEIQPHPVVDTWVWFLVFDSCSDTNSSVNRQSAHNRITSEEKRAIELASNDMYKELRLAAESHRQTRKYMQSYIKPGMTMIHIWYVNTFLVLLTDILSIW